MGFWDLFKNLGNADGIRETIRMSYDKHHELAKSGRASAPNTSPAQVALYGALASRYRTAGLTPPESVVWGELAPFLGLSASDGREYLAEYIVYKEKPSDAKVQDLRKKVEYGLKVAGKDVRVMAAVAVKQGVAWGSLLDKDALTTLTGSV